MLFSSVTRWLKRSRQSDRSRPSRPQRRLKPQLEALEDRCVPSTLTVNNTLDTGVAGDGSLRGEIAAAQSGDTIHFAANLNGATITLGKTLDINKSLTIDGAGTGVTVNGGGNEVFLIEGGVVADINALTISGGVAQIYGGGIYNKGFLTLTNSTVTGNSAATGAGINNATNATMLMSGDTVNINTAQGDGGGVANSGTLTITNCTITANNANVGGGIANFGVLDVVNSTVASNAVTGAGADGGGIFEIVSSNNQLALLNTIVFNPGSGAKTNNEVLGTIDQAQADLFGSDVTIASGGDHGGNKVGFEPLLGPLQNNGGPTATMALLPGSKAIGAGVSSSSIPGLFVPTNDQRGDPRPANGLDLGAFQTQPTPPPSSLQPPLSFVQALYNDFLGRNGAASELSQWVNLLPALGQGAVAYAISHSPEALTHAVDGFYVQFLGRAAVGGEEAGWVAALQHGATEEQVIAGLLSSSEFAAHANALIGGANADANYVQALYQLLLSRTGSTTEVNAWLGALPRGRASVALGFLASAEYRGDMVIQFYATLLDRVGAPTASEAAGWVNSGLDMLAMEAGFASSAEYFQNG
jgi:hypothetical protein